VSKLGRLVLIAAFIALAAVTHAAERLSPDECRSLRARLAALNLSKTPDRPDTATEGLLRLELERELRQCPGLEVLAPAPRQPTPAADCRTVTEKDGSETTICRNR
jgi:hypothetical protein